MLVLCVGMYRACSTWQYGVAGLILERHRAGSRLGFVDGGRFAAEVESGLDPSAWQILKAHDAHDRFAAALEDGRARAIYSHRDLRDVAFSWVHKTGADFETVIGRGFLDLCLANDRFWRAQPATLVQSYDDLTADPERGVTEIASHLGIELGSGEAAEIASALSPEANRRRTAVLAERIQAKGVVLDSRDQDSYDPTTLLHWNHLRDAQADGWRETATPGQLATLARVCGSWLIETGYESDDAWAHSTPAIPSAAYAASLPRVSYAQNAEDIVLDRLFRGRAGTYLDIGANHPTHNNNSYFFYLRGWRGVCIEPGRKVFPLFEARRPGDLSLPVAISDIEGELTFYEVPDCDGLSSLSSEVADEQRGRGFEVVEHRVSTRTVASLVEEFALEPPEFVSIDVEGAEEKVLRGIPLATWQPMVFVIEATRPMTNTPSHQSWEPILLEHGYLFAAFDGINRYYVRGDLAHLIPTIALPVNSLDLYERADTSEHRHRAETLGRLLDDERARAEESRAGWERQLADARGQVANYAETAEQFVRERDAWQRERDAWQRERDAVQAERDMVQRERDSVQCDRDAWQSERDMIQRERDSVQRERDAWQSERNMLQRERDAWQSERDMIQRERDSVQRERDAWQSERDAVQAEREGWLRDDVAYRADRDRLHSLLFQSRNTSDSLATELDAVRADRDSWVAEARDFRSRVEALTEEIAGRIADREALLVELANRESAIEALRAQVFTGAEERGEIARRCAERSRAAARLESVLKIERAARRECRAALDDERTKFDREEARWIASQEAADREAVEYRASWVAACGDREKAIAEGQGQLRPYRLIDRFGLVVALHRRARGLKRFLPRSKPGSAQGPWYRKAIQAARRPRSMSR